VLAALRLDAGRLRVPRTDGDREAAHPAGRQAGNRAAATAQASRLRALLLAGDGADRQAARRALDIEASDGQSAHGAAIRRAA
jgi:hypothetical protein